MKIGILLYDQLTALDAIGPCEVLSRLPGASVQWVGRALSAYASDSGAVLMATATFDDVDELDILVVPGGPGSKHAAKEGDLLDWVRRMHTTTRYTTSVCTGADVLAAAGILDGLRATTHWACRHRLDALGIEVARERVVVQGKVITAAGVASGIDMAIGLVDTVAGKAVGQSIQAGIEYFPSPPHRLEDMDGTMLDALGQRVGGPKGVGERPA